MAAQQYSRLVDPRLGSAYNERELECLVAVVALCVRPNPALRPKMEQVRGGSEMRVKGAGC